MVSEVSVNGSRMWIVKFVIDFRDPVRSLIEHWPDFQNSFWPGPS